MEKTSTSKEDEKFEVDHVPATCPQCGRDIPSRKFEFCPWCGVKFDAQDEGDYTEDKMQCPECPGQPNLIKVYIKKGDKYIEAESIDSDISEGFGYCRSCKSVYHSMDAIKE